MYLVNYLNVRLTEVMLHVSKRSVSDPVDRILVDAKKTSRLTVWNKNNLQFANKLDLDTDLIFWCYFHNREI